MRHSILPKLGVVAYFSICSVQAAEKVTYQDAADRLALETLHPPRVTIWTTDGQKLGGRRWKVDSEGASLKQQTSFLAGTTVKTQIKRDQIGRIQSRDFGRFSGRLFMVAGSLKSDLAKQWRGHKSVGLKVLITLPSAPVWAYIAAAAPVHLAADGVAVLAPKKDFEIVR